GDDPTGLLAFDRSGYAPVTVDLAEDARRYPSEKYGSGQALQRVINLIVRQHCRQYHRGHEANKKPEEPARPYGHEPPAREYIEEGNGCQKTKKHQRPDPPQQRIQRTARVTDRSAQIKPQRQ